MRAIPRPRAASSHRPSLQQLIFPRLPGFGLAAKIQNDLRILTERLARINDNLARKITSRNEYDKTIQETEAAYSKVRVGSRAHTTEQSRMCRAVPSSRSGHHSWSRELNAAGRVDGTLRGAQPFGSGERRGERLGQAAAHSSSPAVSCFHTPLLCGVD